MNNETYIYDQVRHKETVQQIRTKLTKVKRALTKRDSRMALHHIELAKRCRGSQETRSRQEETGRCVRYSRGEYPISSRIRY